MTAFRTAVLPAHADLPYFDTTMFVASAPPGATRAADHPATAIADTELRNPACARAGMTRFRATAAQSTPASATLPAPERGP